MTKHVIKIEDQLTVVGAKGFTPKGSIGVVPEDIPAEDYQYLQSTEILDAYGLIITGYVISVDETKKASGLVAEQQRKDEEAMKSLRVTRDLLLSSTDFTQLNDSPMTAEMKQEYVVYRQALRDLPDNTQDVHNPVYPTKPGSN